MAEDAQRAKHGVAVDAEDGREVHRGRQPLARLGLAVGDGPPDFRCDLFVQVRRISVIELDLKHWS